MTRTEWVEYGLEKGYLKQVSGFLMIPRVYDKPEPKRERSFLTTVED